MKDRLAEVVDEVVITGQDTEEKMCSCESDVVDETCSSESYDACGVCRLDYEAVSLDFTGFPELHPSYLLNLKGQNAYMGTCRGGIWGEI